MYFDFVYGISVDTREKTNRESAHSQTFGLLSASGLRPSLESALRARKIGFAYPHSRSSCLSATTARPFIGIVRANPVGAPAPPIIDVLLDLMS